MRLGLDKQRIEMTDMFNKKYVALENEFNFRLRDNMSQVIDTISVELLYELANQMNYFDLKNETDEEKYIKESVKYRIQEIFENTMNSIKKYANMKNEKQAHNKFLKKKKEIEKNFDIKF